MKNFNWLHDGLAESRVRLHVIYAGRPLRVP
jgi:hypothetical protein